MNIIKSLFCEHDIIWDLNKFTGVYPPVRRGVCKKCGKEFKRKEEYKNESIKTRNVKKTK